MKLSFTLLASCILLIVALRGLPKSDRMVGKNNIICFCAILIMLSAFAIVDHIAVRRQFSGDLTSLRLMTSALALMSMTIHLNDRKARLVTGVTLAAMTAISFNWFMDDAFRQWFLYGYSALVLLVCGILCVSRLSAKLPADAARKKPQTASRQQSEDEKMAPLFARVEEYMQKDKPYLEIDFSEDDLATALYTNKAYLSRTINRSSGKNFCRYVNAYRVDYAIDLMRKNPRMKVADISMMSGFHTVVSFNMAFKLVTNCTPGEYQRNIQAERL